MTPTVIAAIAGMTVTILGCAVTVGMVLAKVNSIDEVRRVLAKLVDSNHDQDLSLARITEHLGISPHRSRMYESK